MFKCLIVNKTGILNQYGIIQKIENPRTTPDTEWSDETNRFRKRSESPGDRYILSQHLFPL